ncbi:MAG: electron transfer flavoprotein subunit beta/FixA family protein [Desulfosalsimonadaceae bacterium]
MKILVCAKDVPDPDHVVVRVREDDRAVIGEVSEYRMNRFDAFAVEEALRIREALGNAAIDVLTVGPSRAKDVPRRGVGMGADRGIHLETQADGYLSPRTKAAWIATYARGKGYDLILTGAMSEDMMNGQVGPMVAAFLNLPWATQVIRTRLPREGKNALAPVSSEICVEREIEGGSREILEIALPAVLALQTGINEPRYPSLSNLLRANKQEMETVAVALAGAGNEKAMEDMAGMEMPQKMRAGRHLEGSPSDKAGQLIAILQDKALLS